MQSDQLGASRTTAAAPAGGGLFHEPSPNGEVVPPPASALPGVPAMPDHFVAPTADEHLRPDAARGAGALGD